MNNAKLEKEVDVFTIGENVKASNGSDERRRFAISLSTLLANKGIGQKQLAEQVGMTEASISEYCTGKKDPKLTTIVRMAAALGVDCHRLLTGVDAEYKEISETTGLSQKAIDSLCHLPTKACYNRYTVFDVLNHIIEAPDFDEILFRIAVALDCCYQGAVYNGKFHSDADGIEFFAPRTFFDKVSLTMPVSISQSEYGEYALSKAMQLLSDRLKTIYNDALEKEIEAYRNRVNNTLKQVMEEDSNG